MRRPALLLLAVLAGALSVNACGGGGGGDEGEARTTPTGIGGGAGTAPPAASRTRSDWLRFGYNAARTNVAPSGLAAAQVRRLSEKRVQLPGTVDSSPVYLGRARVRGKVRSLLIMTTTYGRTIGVDAASGAVLWRFTPGSYSSLAGSPQITTATPVVDPGRRYVFTASPDGRIHKLAVTSGREVRSGGWPVSVTRDASHEKIASALNLDGRNVLVTTGGYLGDVPPYQGKVLAIDRGSGHVAHVFNSLCANRRRIIDPRSCNAQASAIWGRAGAVVDPSSHRIYATSSNGPFDGRTNWADSVLELSPAAGRLLRHYTPTNEKELAATDSDLGSAAPALLPDPQDGRVRHLLQGGKDGKLRLLSLSSSLHGVTGSDGPRLGGEVQSLPLPGGDQNMFTAPAVLHRRGLTEAFVATNSGTAAYVLEGGRLRLAWQNDTGGTSPVLAGGLLYVYDPSGGLNVYRPASGALARHLDAPPGHWSSPIVAGGRVYLPSGDSNDHATSGVLSIYRVR